MSFGYTNTYGPVNIVPNIIKEREYETIRHFNNNISIDVFVFLI